MNKGAKTLALAFLLLGGLSACGGDDDGADTGAESDAPADAPSDAPAPVIVLPDEREACGERNPLRNPYFGDLHVHTAFSFDAAAYDVRLRPADAYRFARGEEVGLPPYDAAGEPTRTYRLRRPLDFAAVTDHSELLAETSICTDPGSEGYESRTCRSYRDADVSRAGYGEFTNSVGFYPPMRVSLCGSMPGLCQGELGAAWMEIQEAAETAYDRTASCGFSTFVGYEWTGSLAGINLHRNIIFRNRSVLRVPLSYVDIPDAHVMLSTLDEVCNQSETPCEALSIPHNGNLGAGDMFRTELASGLPYTQESATMRARMEPLVEIYQHKGSSECVTGIGDPLASEDELCSFEQIFDPLCDRDAGGPEGCTPHCEDRRAPTFLRGCIGPSDFVRPTLRTGLSVWRDVGVNPYQQGIIASTDTHNGLPGAVRESDWPGHLGDSEDELGERLDLDNENVLRGRTSSPGGLAVLWAEENSRDALFDAMQRREAYGTSGPRIVLRFFGGWEYPDTLCDASDLVAQGYADGVPMGAELGARPEGSGGPVFVISTLRDPMGALLQRVQIIKGWHTSDGTEERVYEVAGNPENGASVNLETCEAQGEGADQLCAVWRDPDFDPTQAAFYYVRVVQNPTCRWNQWLCLESDVDCTTLSSDDPLYGCCDARIRTTVQERAWSSPIWFFPEA